MPSFIQTRPRVTALLSVITLGSISVYLSKRHLNRSCPLVPISQLPKSSACRNLFEAGEPATQTPMGTDKSVLLSTWPSGDKKTHWVPSFVALQVDIPISQLEKYSARDKDETDSWPLMRNLVAAFLDARGLGPDSWLIDGNVPPLSFTPGSLLFGKGKSLGAFMLGAWSSTRGTPLEPLAVPLEGGLPVSEFPSNRDVISTPASDEDTDAAGAVIYWKAPNGLIKKVDKAASHGVPWRLMEGGFQEFIVERGTNDTARVTYVTIECTNLHPGGEPGRDFKMLPRVLYELHVLYAQILLFRTLWRLGGG
ncbi:hypothetical protein BJX76DRAFT_335930 [Aspergillus varians]